MSSGGRSSRRSGLHGLVRCVVYVSCLTAAIAILAQACKSSPLVSIGTHPVGSFFNAIGTAVAKVIADHTAIRATVTPVSGPVAWFPFMERSVVDLGVLNMWDAEMGWKGQSVYGNLSRGSGFPIRLVAVCIDSQISLVVAADSQIHSISDLRGRRVCGNFPTPSLQLQTEAMLANGGLTWQDVTPIAVNSVSEAVMGVMEGRADASGTLALGTPAIDELNAKKGARLLPIDPSPEAVARSRAFFPGSPVKVLPGPGNTGVEKEQYLWSYDIYLVCRQAMADEVVYEIVKALWEHRSELGTIHDKLRGWTAERFVSTEARVPYHPGAIRLYKEMGVWTEEMEQRQAELLRSAGVAGRVQH